MCNYNLAFFDLEQTITTSLSMRSNSFNKISPKSLITFQERFIADL